MAHIYKYNVFHRPNSMAIAIVIVTALVTLWQWSDERVGLWLQLSLPGVWLGDFWRIGSYGLVHGGPIHLLMNCYFIWVIGTILEPMLGKLRFLMVHVLSILGGGILVVLLGNVFVPTVGASGGAYGLFGALLAAMYARFGSLRAMWNVPQSRHLLIVFGINVAISFSPGISLLGHLGGLVVGAPLGYMTERYFSRHWDRNRLFIATGVVLILVVVGFVYVLKPVHRGGYWLVVCLSELDKVNEYAGQKMTNETRAAVREHVRKAREAYSRTGSDPDTSPPYQARMTQADKRLGELQRVIETWDKLEELKQGFEAAGFPASEKEPEVAPTTRP